MALRSEEKHQRHSERMRERGMRPVQVRLRNLRNPAMAEEGRRQVRVITQEPRDQGI